MAVEAERGCGYRKVGGLYLCGEGLSSIVCDRLPYELKVCPTCGEGVKFSRGFQWLNWLEYAGKHGDKFDHAALSEFNLCSCRLTCPVCHPEMVVPLASTPGQPDRKSYGLLWVGEEFYTPASFINEAVHMGVSRRIPAIPKNLKLDLTWVLLAHIRACGERPLEEPPFSMKPVAGVFYAFMPQRVELLVWESEATPERLTELFEKNITPVIIPDGDVDHDPRTSLKPKAGEKNKLFFDNLRESLKESL